MLLPEAYGRMEKRFRVHQQAARSNDIDVARETPLHTDLFAFDPSQVGHRRQVSAILLASSKAL